MHGLRYQHISIYVHWTDHCNLLARHFSFPTDHKSQARN